MPYALQGVKGLNDKGYMGQQADEAQPGDSFSRILNIVIKIWGGLLR